jgi:hypothetical protein
VKIPKSVGLNAHARSASTCDLDGDTGGVVERRSTPTKRRPTTSPAAASDCYSILIAYAPRRTTGGPPGWPAAPCPPWLQWDPLAKEPEAPALAPAIAHRVDLLTVPVERLVI